MKNMQPNASNREKNNRRSESGVALAIVALVLLMLTVLIISSHYTLLSQITTSSNYRYSTQAFYIAEAGIQRSIDFFSYQYDPPTPGTTSDWEDASVGLNTRVYPNQFGTNKQVILDSRDVTF